MLKTPGIKRRWLESWDGWELGRTIVVFAAILYGGIWLQMTLFHWAAAFRRWEMLPPVLLTPAIIVLALIGAVEREGIAGYVALGGLVLGVLEGTAGLFFHVRGALAQVGGVSVRNFMAGPPPVLPLAYALTGVLGLTGLLWDA